MNNYRLIFALLFLFGGLQAQIETLPLNKKFVNDFEDILTNDQEKKLSKNIIKMAKIKGDAVAIVTVASFEPYKSIEDYANALIHHWDLGGDDFNGVLIVVSKKQRKARIETGSGVWERFSDEEAKSVIDNIFIPNFKAEKYNDGLLKGLKAIDIELKAGK